MLNGYGSFALLGASDSLTECFHVPCFQNQCLSGIMLSACNGDMGNNSCLIEFSPWPGSSKDESSMLTDPKSETIVQPQHDTHTTVERTSEVAELT